MRLSFPVSTENGYLNSWSKAQHSIWNAVWDRKQAPQSKEQVFHHYSLFPVLPHTAIINYGTLKCNFPTLSEGLVIFDSSSIAASNSDLLELNKQKSEAFPHSSLFFCVLIAVCPQCIVYFETKNYKSPLLLFKQKLQATVLKCCAEEIVSSDIWNRLVFKACSFHIIIWFKSYKKQFILHQLTYCYSAHFLSGSWQTFPCEHPSLAQKEHNKAVLQAILCTYKTWSMFECHPHKNGTLKCLKKYHLRSKSSKVLWRST